MRTLRRGGDGLGDGVEGAWQEVIRVRHSPLCSTLLLQGCPASAPLLQGSIDTMYLDLKVVIIQSRAIRCYHAYGRRAHSFAQIRPHPPLTLTDLP
jgi:hypothetical protein